MLQGHLKNVKKKEKMRLVRISLCLDENVTHAFALIIFFDNDVCVFFIWPTNVYRMSCMKAVWKKEELWILMNQGFKRNHCLQSNDENVPK